jgi:hypothetical protein
MATTDIDGTPLLLLGPDEAGSLLIELRNVTYYARRRNTRKLVAKLEKFLADPDVTKWREKS